MVGRWFIDKIKYFFWSMVASGVVMMASVYSPKIRHQVFSSIKSAQVFVKENAPKTIADKIPDLKFDLLQPQYPQKVDQASVKHVSSSSSEYVMDNKHYVLIDGKYYEARPDNVYMVNGKRVFYVSNRPPPEPMPKDRGSGISKISGGADDLGSPLNSGSGQGSGGASANESSEDESSSGLPTTPSEMMKALQNAQENMKKRNEALKQLENDK